MSIYRISHPTGIVTGKMELPGSKSVANRLLIMKALGGLVSGILNLPESDDVHLMQKGVRQLSGIMNIENAGTCMRFLTAYYALRATDIILHGNERMHNRPIAPLVNALRQLGADIDYIDKEGYPPLRIKGKSLQSETVHVDASISSQYISALLLIAPFLPQGLTLLFSEDPVSFSYINLTLSLMQNYGITARKSNRMIRVEPGVYINKQHICPADWSAASFAYTIAGLSKDFDVLLPHLSVDDLQGDSIVQDYMARFGIETSKHTHGIKLTPVPVFLDTCNYNLSDTPDLAPALSVFFAAKQIKAELSGLAHLAYKETNRLEAIYNELNACGFSATRNENTLFLNPYLPDTKQIPRIRTYGDHRMAMSFASLALIFRAVDIEDPGVVNKSFPAFWNQLSTLGFQIDKL